MTRRRRTILAGLVACSLLLAVGPSDAPAAPPQRPSGGAPVDELHRRGEEAFARGDLVEASRLFYEAIRAAPAEVHYYIDLVLVLNAAKRYDKSLSVLEAAGKAATSPSARAMYLSGYGETMLALQRAGEAFAAFEEWRTLDRGAEPALLGGAAKEALGDLDGARAIYAAALAAHPGDHRLHYRVANLEWVSGRRSEAEAAVERSLKLQPSAEARYLAGKVAMGRGDNAQAVEHFTEAFRLDPSLTSTHYQLSLCYARLGEHAKADAAAARYRELLDKERERQLRFDAEDGSARP